MVPRYHSKHHALKTPNNGQTGVSPPHLPLSHKTGRPTQDIIFESLRKAASKSREGLAFIFPHLISDRYSAYGIMGLPIDKHFQV